jgi:CelD/BcsL family acetyltransferase involved in cellulose biosynthesis
MLHVERAGGHSAIEQLAAEWEQLEEKLQPRTPFTSPLWNALWWKHFSASTAWVRDELFVHTVRNEFGGLIAVAPMMLTMRPAFGPLRVRALQLLGADENVTELRSLIARPEDLPEVLATLRDYFLATSNRWDWLQWAGIPETGAGRELLDGGGRIQWGRRVPNYYLPLPGPLPGHLEGSWEDFKSKLSRNMKEALRKCYNSLKRAGHEFELRVISGPNDAGAAIESFFELHAERSRATNLPAHANVFARESARGFLREYAQRMAERDQLRIFQLVISGEVVATRVGFVLGGDLYLYYSGFRVAWAQHSVMTTVVSEAIKWAITRGFRGIDLSTGRDVSKLRWKPTEFVTWEGVQSSPNRLGQLAAGAYQHVAGVTPNSVLGRLLSSARRAKL